MLLDKVRDAGEEPAVWLVDQAFDLDRSATLAALGELGVREAEIHEIEATTEGPANMWSTSQK